MTSISEMDYQELRSFAEEALRSIPRGAGERYYLQTILSLLDRLEAVERERDEAREQLGMADWILGIDPNDAQAHIVRLRNALQTALCSMNIASGITAVAREYDFDEPCAIAREALTASPSVNQSTQGKEDSR